MTNASERLKGAREIGAEDMAAAGGLLALPGGV